MHIPFIEETHRSLGHCYGAIGRNCLTQIGLRFDCVHLVGAHVNCVHVGQGNHRSGSLGGEFIGTGHSPVAVNHEIAGVDWN